MAAAAARVAGAAGVTGLLASWFWSPAEPANISPGTPHHHHFHDTGNARVDPKVLGHEAPNVPETGVTALLGSYSGPANPANTGHSFAAQRVPVASRLEIGADATPANGVVGMLGTWVATDQQPPANKGHMPHGH